jgi:hypothetical protein
MARSKTEEIKWHIVKELKARGFEYVELRFAHARLTQVKLYYSGKALAALIEAKRDLKQPKWFMLREVCEHADDDTVYAYVTAARGWIWGKGFEPRMTFSTDVENAWYADFAMGPYDRENEYGKLHGGVLQGSFDCDILQPVWETADKVCGALHVLITAETRRVVAELDWFITFMCLALGKERRELDFSIVE